MSIAQTAKSSMSFYRLDPKALSMQAMPTAILFKIFKNSQLKAEDHFNMLLVNKEWRAIVDGSLGYKENNEPIFFTKNKLLEELRKTEVSFENVNQNLTQFTCRKNVTLHLGPNLLKSMEFFGFKKILKLIPRDVNVIRAKVGDAKSLSLLDHFNHDPRKFSAYNEFYHRFYKKFVKSFNGYDKIHIENVSGRILRIKKFKIENLEELTFPKDVIVDNSICVEYVKSVSFPYFVQVGNLFSVTRCTKVLLPSVLRVAGRVSVVQCQNFYGKKNLFARLDAREVVVRQCFDFTKVASFLNLTKPKKQSKKCSYEPRHKVKKRIAMVYQYNGARVTAKDFAKKTRLVAYLGYIFCSTFSTRTEGLNN